MAGCITVGCSETDSGGIAGGATCDGATNPTNGPLCRTNQDCANAGAGGFASGTASCYISLPSQGCGRFRPRECTTNANCADGGICQTDTCGGSTCVPACNDATCTGTSACQNGLCSPKRCDAPGAAPCETGFTCRPTDPSASSVGCVPIHCTKNADCQAGYDCNASAPGNGCVHRACKADNDCACGYCVNSYCEATLGFCYTIVATPYGCVWPDEELV